MLVWITSSFLCAGVYGLPAKEERHQQKQKQETQQGMKS